MKKESIRPFLISIAAIIILSIISFYNWKNLGQNLKEMNTDAFSQVNDFARGISLNLETESKPFKEIKVNEDLKISYPENWTNTSKELLGNFRSNGLEKDAELLLLVNSYSINSTPIFLIIEKVNKEALDEFLVENKNINIIQSQIKDNYYFIEAIEKKEDNNISVYSKSRIYPTKNDVYYVSLIGILESWKEENDLLIDNVLNSIQINSEIVFSEEEINNLINSSEQEENILPKIED